MKNKKSFVKNIKYKSNYYFLNFIINPVRTVTIIVLPVFPLL